MTNLWKAVFLFLAASNLQAIDNMSEEIKESVHVVGKVLSKYTRPFTLLGMGKDVDLLVENKSQSYPDSVFVLFDKMPRNEQGLSSLKNIIWLNHQLLFKEAKDLASCEHVDVLLLFNPLHMFASRWKKALSALRQMAHVIIIQLPKNGESEIESVPLKVMHTYLSQLSGVVIVEGASSIYYILEGKEPFPLIKTTLIHPKKRRWSYEIYCDYTHKNLKKLRPNWVSLNPWFPGINMMTYLMFNGTIPSRDQVLENLPLDPEHTDWLPNNMVVQGRNVLLIDKNDPISGSIEPDGGERFSRLKADISEFILKTRNLPPQEVRKAFISIYNWGDYFDQTEIEE